MVITNIIGGLGNQMFQYAAGLALSLERDTPLAISVDMFEGYSLHQGFELERVFGINVPRVGSIALEHLIGWRAAPLARRVLAKVSLLKPLCGRHFIAESHGITLDRLFSADSDTYLHGYWQSSSYFGCHGEQVRRAFTFTEEPDSQNADMLAEIAAGPSASVHIRRGDYLAAKNTAIYNQCSSEYFLSSMQFLQERLGVLKFFVFSDDTQWAARFLADKGYDCRIVAHNMGSASYNDMRLMSTCDHHIIANSSFSWWGAWLNQKSDKIVIAPRQWMAGVSSSRVIPTTWLTR